LTIYAERVDYFILDAFYSDGEIVHTLSSKAGELKIPIFTFLSSGTDAKNIESFFEESFPA
jgi:Holliday junction resolvasome RuvABC ATP-dependent DNA helicase subunit